MHDTQVTSGRYKRYAFGLGIIVSVAYLMFYYRNVGLHDGFVYIQAGQDVANRENPYKDGITRSGTASSLILYALYTLIPNSIVAQMFQVLNFSCIAWFLWSLRGQKWEIENYLLAVLVSFWLSPIRELLAINQVNAFVVALIGTIIWISSNHGFNHKYLKHGGMGLCFALAIDLKPHLLLVVLVVWAVSERNFNLILWTIGIFTALHLAINLYIGEITEVTWISRLLTLKDGAATTQFGDSVTFWPIFQKIFPNWIDYVPTISLILLLIVSLWAAYEASKQNANSAILLALAAPAFFVYFHFYDMISIALIFVAHLIQSKIKFQHLTLLCLLLIPKEFTSLKNLALVIGMATIVWLNSAEGNKSFKNLYLGLVGYGLICMVNCYIFAEPRLTQSIFVSEILILLLWSSVRLCRHDPRSLLIINSKKK